MQKEASSCAIENITINFKLSVDVVSTDRHLSIKKMVWVDTVDSTRLSTSLIPGILSNDC